MTLLSALHARGDAAAIVAGSVASRWCDLAQQAEGLRPAIRERRGGAVALAAPGAGALLAHAAAAEAEGVELHLLRRSFAPGDVARLRSAFGLQTLDEPPGARRDGTAGAACVAIYTSGTTAAPKPTLHRWTDLLPRPASAARAAGAAWLLTYDPATYAGVRVLTQAVAGAGSVIEPSSPTLASVADAISHHGAQITAISATPSMLRGLLAHLGDDALRGVSLRQITLGGEAADDALLARLRSAFPAARIVHVYASSEAGAVFSVSDGRAGFPVQWLGRELAGGVVVSIADGALHVRNPASMRGYAGEGRASEIDTGDLVEVRGDRVHFIGRAEETLVVGGAKVRPAEVEAVLLSVPGVAAARVYGKRSSLVGQIVAADIVAARGYEAASVVIAARAQAEAHLAPHKVPRFLEAVESLDLNDSGKAVGRRAVR